MPTGSRITVAIPVGPERHHADYLEEALASVRAQTVPAEILLIDDMHGLPDRTIGSWDCGLWRAPWRLGVGSAFNMGVALARTELVFLLGADDTMEPQCLEQAVSTWEQNGRQPAYYYAGVRYMDTGESQTVPCGEAMVTKKFWKMCGGFPIESAVGAPDAALISILMVHFGRHLIPIADGQPLVNYRRHANTDTATRPVSWQGPILATRDILTRTFKAPAWGRYQ